MRACLISKRTPWTKRLVERLKHDRDIDWHFFDDASADRHMEGFLEAYSPSWVFFFHWSKMVSASIYEKYRCVGFHTSNLPEGRGGSPMQNQIISGVMMSRLNAIQLTDVVDAGDVYAFEPVTLQGTATDIWFMLADAAGSLMRNVVCNNPKPTPQRCLLPASQRIKDNSLDMGTLDVYDVFRQIQMVDGEGYPSAYIDVGKYRISFDRAQLKGDSVLCDAVMTERES